MNINMNYETAFKTMVAGHAVKRGNMVYFIPSTAQPTENNIRSIYLEDEPHPMILLRKTNSKMIGKRYE